MKKLVFLLLAFFGFHIFIKAQTDLAIGQWKSHLPFNSGIYLTQSDDRIYYATKYALLIIDKDDHAIERLTKVEGLSRVGVSLVKYNRMSNVLVVVYDNGVIDLVDESGVQTLPNIPGSNIVLGEKKVYDVFMANDSLAYLAANFGITTLNLKTGLFPNTVKTAPVEVKAVQMYQGKLFAATTEGIYTIDPSSGVNIDDFSNWTLLDGEIGLPPLYSSDALTVFNGKLYMDVNDSLYVFDETAAQYVHHEDTLNIKFLTSEGAHLLAGFVCPDACTRRVLIFNTDHSFQIAPASCVSFPNYAIEDANGNIWYADEAPGFKVGAPETGTCEQITVNSPYSINVFTIIVQDNQVWVASGGVDLTFSYRGRRDGIFSLIDGTWNVYSPWFIPELADLTDFLDVVVNPATSKIYAASYLDGLVEYDPVTGGFTVYNETNSSLQLTPLDQTRTRVAGLSLDQDGNLWMTNNLAPRPLSVLRANGTWQSYDLPCTPEDGLFRIAVDQFGYLWITTINNNIGVIVFDPGDLDDPNDNRCKVLTSANSVLPTNEVNTVEVDLDGGVWVGTKSGAVVFQCDPFGDCPGTRPFVEVDGFGANLLEDQDVRTIGVDGANRKWFGTNTGVFVMSPEGNEQIAKFTAENSPLFDNNIVDIAFNHETGEVYIGTVKGIISYRSDATGAENFHSNVLVFPNPVRPGYDGPIAIKGLARDASVKITDVSGQLMYETEALGGQAVWNGRDYNGRKANTGVYLVFATSRNSSDPEVVVAKILVVN